MTAPSKLTRSLVASIVAGALALTSVAVAGSAATAAGPPEVEHEGSG